MSTPETCRSENPDHCAGSVDVTGAFTEIDDISFCDTCGGRHEVRSEDAPGGRVSVKRVEWAPGADPDPKSG